MTVALALASIVLLLGPVVWFLTLVLREPKDTGEDTFTAAPSTFAMRTGSVPPRAPVRYWHEGEWVEVPVVFGMTPSTSKAPGPARPESADELIAWLEREAE